MLPRQRPGRGGVVSNHVRPPDYPRLLLAKGEGVEPSMHREAHVRFRGGWACRVPKPFLIQVPAGGVAPPSPAYETGVLLMHHAGEWGERRESNPYFLSHSQACKPLHHAHQEECTWSESHGRLAVIDRRFWLLNYRCERPAGSAPAISTLATWRLARSTTAAMRLVGTAGFEPAQRAPKTRGLPVSRSPRVVAGV